MNCPECGRPIDPAGEDGNEARCPACVSTHLRAGTPAPAEATLRTGPPAPLEAALPGSAPALGRYRLERRLGGGAMGVVWKAWDEQIGRAVALKLLRSDLAAEPLVCDRFLREARLAARLRHPGIVAVHDVGQLGADLYLTMDLVEGRTLHAVWAESRAATAAAGLADADRVRREVAQLAGIAEAVGAAHAEGVIHRDLKPANVLIDAAGVPLVTDFGLAKDLGGPAGTAGTGAALTVQGEILGTPAYMSPEQARADGTAIGPPSDVWSLGVMLFEILTGTLPFTGASAPDVFAAILQGEAPRPSARAPGVDCDLEALCLAALEPEAVRRPAHAGAFARELRRWLAGEPLSVRRVTRLERARRWIGRRPRTAAVAAGVALGLLVSVGWGAGVRMRARAAERATLEEVTHAAAALERSIRSVEMPLAARRALGEQTLALLDDRIRRDPDFGPAWSWRGSVRELIGDLAGAEADFDEGCRRSPDSPVPWALRGISRIQRHLDRRGNPRLVLEPSGARLHPRGEETPDERALRQAGLADLERLAGLDAGALPPALDGTIFLGRAMEAYASGRPGGAEAALGWLDRVDRAPGWKLAGLLLVQRDQFVAAAAALDRAIALWPEDGSARTLRALAHLAEGARRAARGEPAADFYARASADLDEALRREPESIDARHLRALALERQSRAQDPEAAARTRARAMQDVEALIERRPTHSGAHVLRADLLVRAAEALVARGEDARAAWTQARDAYDRALELGGPEHKLRIHRGHVQVKLARERSARGGDVRECVVGAEEDFRAGLAAGHGDACFALGDLFSRMNRWDEADALLAACAREAEAHGERAAGQLALLRTDRAIAAHPWLAEIAAAGLKMKQLDYAEARTPYLRALDAWDEALRALPEPERARWVASASARWHLGTACYNLACIETALSQGRATPSAPARPLPDAVRWAYRERAWAFLAQAMHWGWRNPRQMAADPDLAPLRDDPRFVAMLLAMRR